MSFATRNHPTTTHILQKHSTTNILETPLVIMDKLICIHERCKRKAIKHGIGYCHLHGKKESVYIHSAPTTSNQTACVSNMAVERRKKPVTTDAPTIPSGMVFVSVTVQSTIAQSLGAASRCFRHVSADLTSGVFCWWWRSLWQHQMQLMVCAMMHLLQPQVVLLVGKNFISSIMMPHSLDYANMWG
jgi:hypothetical protein